MKTIKDVLLHRLANEQLVKKHFTTAQEIVGWFGAVQAQDYAGAKWAVGQRLPKASDALLDNAYDAGEILRTHALRPTWHFVHPDDILWIINLNAPRVRRIMNYYNKQLDLTEKIFKNSQEIFYDALHGGKALTRTELGELLLQAKLPGKGQALGHIMMEAELEGLLCSGPRKGKQFTYMLISERAPNAKEMSKEASLAELTKRYFTSHGPAQIKDFVWWTGLTTEDVKHGLELNKDTLTKETIEGKEYWFSDKTPVEKEMPEDVYLLPNYDEYAIAYKDRSAFYDPTKEQLYEVQRNVIFGHMIVIEGVVVGMWRRILERKVVVIETLLFRALSPSEKKALDETARRYSDFLNLEVVIK